jgi:hypothetical protein
MVIQHIFRLSKIIVISSTVTLFGCATYSSSSFVNELDTRYQSGFYEESALSIESKLDLYDPGTEEFTSVAASKGDVLLHLEAAENWRMTGNLNRSIEHYDAVEVLLQGEDIEGIGSKVGESAGSALVNDTVRSYNPEPAERVLTNFYKALSFWSKGDAEFTRVEFNRANERARIAVESYSEEIESEKSDKDSKVDDKQKNQISSKIDQQFTMIGEWEVYDDFVNPVVAYSNAIFLASTGAKDISKAQDLLVRVRGMVGSNPAIEDDLQNLARYSRLTNGTPTRWIVYEAGLSPTFTQKQFTIPFLFNGVFINAAMAFPELTPRKTGINYGTLLLDNEQMTFYELSTMEKIMRTEFKKKWPGTVTRAVVSATTKAILQHEMAKQLGPMGNLAGFVYSHVTNTADTRIWRAMPEAWYLSKSDASKSATLQIPYGLGLTKEIELPAGVNSFVYIKQPTPNAVPYVQVIEL